MASISKKKNTVLKSERVKRFYKYLGIFESNSGAWFGFFEFPLEGYNERQWCRLAASRELKWYYTGK